MNSGELFAAARAAGITTIRLGIYQPKAGGMREHVITLADLEAFADYARGKEQTALGAAQMRDKMPEGEWARIYLNPTPNEDDCAFCKAMAVCPAAQAVVDEAVALSATDIAAFGKDDTVSVPADSDLLSAKLKAAPFVEDWCSAVRAEAERKMLAGGSVPGFGLELGRQGARKWVDPAAAEEVLRKQMRLTVEEAYNLKIKSPTQVEKLTEGEKPIVGPRQWKKLQDLVDRSPAKPSVKPVGLIKKPYQVPALDAGAFPQSDDCDLT
jgi:hypothetical protein